MSDARLAAALDRLAAGYRFVSDVVVGGQPASHASGRVAGPAAEYVVTGAGGSATYLSIPPSGWVKQPGATAWATTTDASLGVDPLGALRAPTRVDVESTEGGVTVLAATYPGAAFGVDGGGTIGVELRLLADGSVAATYRTATSAGAATSTTTLTPDSNPAPILPPG